MTFLTNRPRLTRNMTRTGTIDTIEFATTTVQPVEPRETKAPRLSRTAYSLGECKHTNGFTKLPYAPAKATTFNVVTDGFDNGSTTSRQTLNLDKLLRCVVLDSLLGTALQNRPTTNILKVLKVRNRTTD